MIPFYLIQVRHYVPAAAGAVFLPLILLMFLFSARVGALVPRVGERFLLCFGAALAGTGFAAFAWLDGMHGYARSVLPPVLILGCGMTLCVAPLTNAVMSSVPETQTGIASAVNNALSRLAGLLAVSLIALLLAHGFVASLTPSLLIPACPPRHVNRCWPTRLACTTYPSRRPFPGCNGSRPRDCSTRRFSLDFAPSCWLARSVPGAGGWRCYCCYLRPGGLELTCKRACLWLPSIGARRRQNPSQPFKEEV